MAQKVSTLSSLPIPPNRKFGILLFANSNLVLSKEYACESLNFSSDKGTVLDDMTKEFIGRSSAERVENGNNFIISFSRPSSELEILNKENIQIMEELSALLYAVTVRFDSRYDICLQLTGSKIGNNIDVRQETYHQPRASHEKVKFHVTQSDLAKLCALYHVIKRIYSIPTYARFKRGLNCLFIASSSQLFDNQLHQYVRSIEGLTMSWGEKGFTSRTINYFDQDDAQSRNMLTQLYHYRNAIEHLGSPPKNPGFFFSLLTRMMSCEIYTNIITDYQLLKQHEDEKLLKLLWEKKKYLSKKINIDQIVKSALKIYPLSIQWK